MRGSLPSPLVTWLVRVALLCLGLAPLQGVVVCFEPDGSIALEAIGGSRACEGCDEAESEQAPVRLVAPEHACCACLDILVEGRGEGASVPGSLGELPLPPAALVGAELPAPSARAQRSSGRTDREPPGPPGALAHLRTVVLQV